MVTLTLRYEGRELMYISNPTEEQLNKAVWHFHNRCCATEMQQLFQGIESRNLWPEFEEEDDKFFNLIVKDMIEKYIEFEVSADMANTNLPYGRLVFNVKRKEVTLNREKSQLYLQRVENHERYAMSDEQLIVLNALNRFL